MPGTTAEIVLCGINAKFVHPAFGLRYLMANLQELRSQAALLEFDLRTPPALVAERILAHAPRLVGMGVHIWNRPLVRQVLACLRSQAPGLPVVLGGPELADPSSAADVLEFAAVAISGEGEEVFPEVCRKLLKGQQPPSLIRAPAANVERLTLPYDLYTDADLAHRITYVETSRGCVYECEYCLSAGDAPVRYFPLTTVLNEVDRLIRRGARVIKFVDRTFNLNLERCCSILEFLLQRMRADLFVHIEMVPQRFPPRLMEVLRRFPAGTLQLEIGVQTFNPEVAARIRRPLDPEIVERTLRELRETTPVLLHVDLLAGLPGEDLESLASGFDRLVRLDPHKIQLGLLKRLPGAAIARHDEPWQMQYDPEPPYTVRSTATLSAEEVTAVERVARYWELMINRGRLRSTAQLLWQEAPSPFRAFLRFSEWLYGRFQRTHSLPPWDLADALAEYLVREQGLSPAIVRERLELDGATRFRAGKKRMPHVG